MSAIRRVAIVAIAALVGAVFPSPSAVADRVSTGDGNDSDGPYDLRSARVGHEGGSLVHRLSMADPFFSIDPRTHSIGIAFDTDGDLHDLERILFFYSVSSTAYRSAMTNGSGRRILSEPDVTRPSQRTIEATFNADKLGRDSLTHYRWFAFAISDFGGGCCADFAPDRGWLRHDIAPPDVVGLAAGAAEGQAIPSTPAPISFSVDDVGGSGPGLWKLLVNDLTASTGWTEVATGAGSGPHTVALPAEVGHTYEVCVRASDIAGNTGMEQLRFAVPVDDAAFTFIGTWTTSGAETTDYQGTRHVGLAGDAFDVVVPPGSHLALVVPGGFDGVARVTSGAIDYGVVSGIGLTGPRALLPITHPSGSSLGQTFHVDVESGTFAIDGFAVEVDLGFVTCPA